MVADAEVSRLRLARQVHGLGLREEARRAGVDHGRLSRIERGLEPPSVEILLKVGRVLGLDSLVEELERWTS